MMTDHDRCVVETWLLERELFGECLSPSIDLRVRQIEESWRIESVGWYGGTRRLEQVLPAITRSVE
jgi:hypothetical protein